MDASDGDTTLFTGGPWGIARYGNILYGNYSTQVNFGVACTTGRSGFGNNYCTVGGGIGNVTEYEATTVGGGSGNRASGTGCFVGGGYNNQALGGYTTVGGGYHNLVTTQQYATIGGGYYDTVSGNYATVPGGYANKAEDYSFAAGKRAKAVHAGTFVWADSSSEDFASTGVEQFLIRASGGVGINKNNPAQALDVNGTAQMTGFKLPTGATAGRVLTSDASGVGTWQATATDNDWSVDASDGDTTLFTGGPWGIARYGNILIGTGDSTHVNLGVACTTGTTGWNRKYATVGGGLGNVASDDWTTVAGGSSNKAKSGSFVGGGFQNSATQNMCFVGGGYKNSASQAYSTVAGGYENVALVGMSYGTVGGGYQDTADGLGATVPGGIGNKAVHYSFAAGRRAKAIHAGTFVWADSSNEDFASTGVEQFLIRASGGVGINKPNPAQALDVNGTAQMTGFKMTTSPAAGRVLTSDASGVGTWQATATDNDWSVDASGGDTALFTGGPWGIARYGNVLYGTYLETHVNLGVSCTTGTSGQNYDYSTVGGGLDNSASGARATVAGGRYNTASGNDAIVGGGRGNKATNTYATVGGGQDNVANGSHGTVGGGDNDTASGLYSTVPGGRGNNASGDYSFAAGRRAKAVNSGSFVWADNQDADFASTGNNQVVVRASGGVGIGTNSPQGALDVSSTTGALIVPRMTTAQRDALTAVNGMIIYNTTTNQFNFRENGAWVTK